MKYTIPQLHKALGLYCDGSCPGAQKEIELFLNFLETNPLKKRSLTPGTNDADADKVMTPPDLAEAIVQHFNHVINGRVLEPCYGQRAFSNALARAPLVNSVYEYEIDNGRDDYLKSYYEEAWFQAAVTNPPYSKLRKFLRKCMHDSQNVVFLCPINSILGSKARLRDVKEAGFYIREVCEVDKPKEWVSSGFAYAAIHLSREQGDCKWTKL